jgi:hypothetical protein
MKFLFNTFLLRSPVRFEVILSHPQHRASDVQLRRGNLATLFVFRTPTFRVTAFNRSSYFFYTINRSHCLCLGKYSEYIYSIYKPLGRAPKRSEGAVFLSYRLSVLLCDRCHTRVTSLSRWTRVWSWYLLVLGYSEVFTYPEYLNIFLSLSLYFYYTKDPRENFISGCQGLALDSRPSRDRTGYSNSDMPPVRYIPVSRLVTSRHNIFRKRFWFCVPRDISQVILAFPVVFTQVFVVLSW